MGFRRGDPLESGERVFRLVKLSNDGKVPPTEFELSPSDRASELGALSVFSQRLTTPSQAVNFMPEPKQSEYRHYAVLLVDDVRTIRPDPDTDEVGDLDVQWDPLEENGDPDTRDGAEGHAGIVGTDRHRYKELSEAKKRFYSIRSQLADLVNGSGDKEATFQVDSSLNKVAG